MTQHTDTWNILNSNFGLSIDFKNCHAIKGSELSVCHVSL